ncbi:small subunit of carbamoyl-phosphate synthase [Powellomyces hirtus]|nr:small subunit of carbamoyl-phosphate synthase [Powellomyces hirtus]
MLRLQTGETFKATSFGAPVTGAPMSGEIVFTTALVGYPESMTDPSYRGQILVFTQPLVGNYGVPAPTKDQFGLLEHFEADGIQVQGIIVNDYATKYSHWNAIESLGQWCARYGVPALTGVDTRAVVTLLRERGSTLAEIRVGDEMVNAEQHPIADPNARNLVAEGSTKVKQTYNKGGDVKVALIDCGAKQNIIRALAKRGAEVVVVPWNHDLVRDPVKYDGVFLSNGPGNPEVASTTALNLRAYMDLPATATTPIFGICMGNQLMGLAAGYKSYKLKYGNRGHNQPALNLVTGKCVITSQNHGYALDDTVDVPGWIPFFRNANDGSNEGIRHVARPWSSVQFHPEAMGGPLDTDYLFDDFLTDVREYKAKKANLNRAAGVSFATLKQDEKALPIGIRVAA